MESLLSRNPENIMFQKHFTDWDHGCQQKIIIILKKTQKIGGK